jgi:hypothetical protein
MRSQTNVDPPPAALWLNRRALLEGIALGACYGLFLRFVALRSNTGGWHKSWFPEASFVMTVAFLVLGPLVMGLLTISRAEAHEPSSVWQWIFVPWISVILMMTVTAIFLLEGAICIVMALPIALVCGSIGGVIGGIIGRQRKLSRTATLCIAVLPFVLGPAEASFRSPDQTRTVSSEIRIHATPAVVWHNIERVPSISPAEIQTTWTQRVGFPRPVEATLSCEGVGGVRHASFERGLLFIETVTAWEPERHLAFSIKADTAHIPSTTLDEHVTIGGRYFDVLDGEYRIEQLSDSEVLLHLTSHQRLSTNFNVYAGLWTDAVMQNLQTNILQVIQHRAEARKL